MKQMLNRMLRYADAIVKRGVDRLIDAIAHSAEPQSKNTVTPQRKKRMGNDTDCAPQTTGSTTNCGLTEQAITLMDELYDIRYNVLDRTTEVQRRDQADKGFVPVSKLVRNTMVIDLQNGAAWCGTTTWTALWSRPTYRSITLSALICSHCSNGTASTAWVHWPNG